MFSELLDDLHQLAAANAAGDAEQVYRRLSRLDAALTDMATRAARFYLMLGDLSRTNDTRPEIFLAHKDALLAHMREFASELSRYSPKLARRSARSRRPGSTGSSSPQPTPTSGSSLRRPSGWPTGASAGRG